MNVIFTSIPYARQDKAYYSGELNTAESLIRKLTKYYGVKTVFAIDAHFANERWTKKWPFINESAAPLLMQKARISDPEMVFMGPDAGSARRAHVVGATKKRENSYSVSVDLESELSASIKGKTVGVVDDILSTGTTLERFYHEAKKAGARKVYALITHGVNPAGIERTRSNFDGLFLTDTINRPEANVFIDDLLVKMITQSIFGARI